MAVFDDTLPGVWTCMRTTGLRFSPANEALLAVIRWSVEKMTKTDLAVTLYSI